MNRDSENRGRNGHVLVWEQPGLDEEERERRRKKVRFGKRHMVTFMIFLGMANAYIMRTNMSVAIVAMVNHTAIKSNDEVIEIEDKCGESTNETDAAERSADGPFVWDNKQQGYLLSSFFWGYVITQIPFGILAKRYGAKYFLGIGMLINSLFGLLVPVSANWGYWPLIIVRFIQGLGEEWINPYCRVQLCLAHMHCWRNGYHLTSGAGWVPLSMPVHSLVR